MSGGDLGENRGFREALEGMVEVESENGEERAGQGLRGGVIERVTTDGRCSVVGG